MGSHGDPMRNVDDSGEDEWMDRWVDWHGDRSVQRTHGNVPPIEGPLDPALARALSSVVGQENQDDSEDSPFLSMANPNDPLAGIDSELRTTWRLDTQEDAGLLQYPVPPQINLDPFVLYNPPVFTDGIGPGQSLVAESRTAEQTRACRVANTWSTTLLASLETFESEVFEGPSAARTGSAMLSTLEDLPSINNHVEPVAQHEHAGLWQPQHVPPSTSSRVDSVETPHTSSAEQHGSTTTWQSIQTIDDVDDTMSLFRHQHLDGLWSCRFPGCSNDKCHRLLSDLKKHQRCHQEKLFSCDRCNFFARFAGHLASHQEDVHQQAIYYCRQCRKRYKQYKNLQRHHHKNHRGMEVPKKEVASNKPAALDAQMPSYQPGLNPTATEWYPGGTFETMIASLSPSSRDGYFAAAGLAQTEPHALVPRASVQFTHLASRAVHDGTFATLQPDEANQDLRPPARTGPTSEENAASQEWQALSQQNSPRVALVSGTSPSSPLYGVSNARLPTPSLSGGSSVVDYWIRSGNGVVQLLPATRSPQRPPVSIPSYSDVDFVNLPSPPSSQPPASQYRNSAGQRHSPRRTNQQFE
ncbi:hypothetical protein LTR17_024938 [Elasticomyces elasticus]|nr:hypothetical protein LTR17_024938 [Elasticomyces elasticus]